MSNIGFIGLDIMGRPVAGHLIAGGHKLFVHDHKSAPQELIDKGPWIAWVVTAGSEGSGEPNSVLRS